MAELRRNYKPTYIGTRISKIYLRSKLSPDNPYPRAQRLAIYAMKPWIRLKSTSERGQSTTMVQNLRGGTV